MKVELKALIEKLNPLCRRAFERAAELCVSQSNYNVEVEHLLKALLDLRDSDLHVVLRHFDVDEADLGAELTAGIDTFRRGNARTPAFSPNLVRLLESAWNVSSLHLASDRIRSGALLFAAVTHPTLRGSLQETAPTLFALNREKLEEALPELVAHSEESGDAGTGGRSGGKAAAGGGAATSAPSGPRRSRGGESALDRFTVDLTSLARVGGIDPVTGRDGEIRQVIDILMRRRQNNPILTGEPGVGKTAIVEGFAMRVASRDVPEPLQEATVRALDLGLLQAGAGIKGEFEQRLKDVIEEVTASITPVILFIDEAHTIIGAGGSEGQGDAANLLKPALARGELRTIAATTWSEYKKYVEKDPALARRFQVIKVDEPDEETARRMLRGMVGHLERHHGVRITEDAIRDAVELSHRHISGRKLPDKAISVLDTACARVAISKSTAPVQLDDAIREAGLYEVELGVLEREQRAGSDHDDRVAHLTHGLAKAKLRRQELEGRWRKERDLVAEIDRIHGILDGTIRLDADDDDVADGEPDLDALRGRLTDANEKLEAIQGDDPLVPTHVDGTVVASVISGWTGIPVGRMVKNEIRTVLSLRKRVEERIVGQPEALEAVCRRIGTSSAGLEDPNKPTGVFLLVGPSGVGKTETARALADYLYGGERNMVSVNMSEYQEAHTVSSLKGAPPGYVGYGTGGVLTEAVRRRPYSVVLLDEVEKAHPDVLELFYQVFDRGQMEDGEGQLIDFKHTLIVLTSNVAADTIASVVRASPERPGADELVEAIRPELRSHFPAAFLGRLITVPFYPLGDAEIRDIVELKLAEIQRRVWETHLTDLTYDPDVVRVVSERCTEVDSGARNIDSILSGSMLPELSTRILEYMADGEPLSLIRVRLDDAGRFAYDLTAREGTAS
ncbi:MAG: type VI secretion system ATPase TssH [Longimicrobiales bacterium]